MVGIEDRSERPVNPMPMDNRRATALSSVVRPSRVDSRAGVSPRSEREMFPFVDPWYGLRAAENREEIVDVLAKGVPGVSRGVGVDTKSWVWVTYCWKSKRSSP